MIDSTQAWRDRLYGVYVSGGQASVAQGAAETVFRSRAPYLRRLVRGHIPKSPGVSILDIGCGHGAILHFLAEAGHRDGVDGAQVIGVDVSAEQVDLAHKLGIPNVVLQDQFSFFSAVTAGSFDVVIAFDVLEHLERADLLRTLDEIFRILKPGGTLVLHVPNAEGIFGAKIRFADLTHELSFTQTSARQMLRACGFDRVDCFEDLPTASRHLLAVARRALWMAGRVIFKLMHFAETGSANVILSQNLLVVAGKSLR